MCLAVTASGADSRPRPAAGAYVLQLTRAPLTEDVREAPGERPRVDHGVPLGAAVLEAVRVVAHRASSCISMVSSGVGLSLCGQCLLVCRLLVHSWHRPGLVPWGKVMPPFY
jgi:hypothetical protein